MTELSPDGGVDAQFAAHLAAGRFMIQRSMDSGVAVYPPVAVAPLTGEDLEWFEPTGDGTVYSVTIVRKKPPKPSYAIALIDLAEGVRMMSRIDGIAPEEVRIGMAVKAHLIEEDGANLVIFKPADVAA